MEVLRSLQNYKEMHRAMAEDRGNLDAFNKCTTLTQARKLAYGEKKKQCVAARIRGSNKK